MSAAYEPRKPTHMKPSRVAATLAVGRAVTTPIRYQRNVNTIIRARTIGMAVSPL